MTTAFRIDEPSWAARLEAELASPEAHALRRFLDEARRAGPVYPSDDRLFRALELTPFDRVRVVILGQDPYHGPGQAHGLAFSVPEGVPPPPSLRNVFRALQNDLGVPPPPNGDLSRWAAQGVLLLNATLSVAEGRAGSHRGRGWERITDRIVRLLDERAEPVAFLLWGSDAQKKAASVDRTRHLVLEAPHPSPLSAHRGFLGCGHFSKVNAWLQSRGTPPVDW